MAHAVRKIMRRFVAIILIASLYFIGLHSAHIHLSETHTAGESHRHGAEAHVAHQGMNHDGIAGGKEHLTDASFVDLEQDGRLSNGPDNLVGVFILLVFLLVAPLVVRARGWPLRERVFRIDTPLSARLGARAPP